MTSNHKKILTIVFFCTMPFLVFSQGPGPTPEGAPISEGIIYLLISGAIYGFRKKLKK